MADLLVDDHAEIDRLLSDMLDGFEQHDARDTLSKLDLMWARLAIHIRAEHLHLFPTLLKALENTPDGLNTAAPSSEEVRAAVERLRDDHDFFMHELAKSVNALRDMVAQDGPAPAEQLSAVKQSIIDVRTRLKEHNRLEEDKVYLWQDALLSAGDRESLLALMKHELENLPRRFSGNSPA